jgi:hypothetical protein
MWSRARPPCSWPGPHRRSDLPPVGSPGPGRRRWIGGAGERLTSSGQHRSEHSKIFCGRFAPNNMKRRRRARPVGAAVFAHPSWPPWSYGFGGLTVPGAISAPATAGSSEDPDRQDHDHDEDEGENGDATGVHVISRLLGWSPRWAIRPEAIRRVARIRPPTPLEGQVSGLIDGSMSILVHAPLDPCAGLQDEQPFLHACGHNRA